MNTESNKKIVLGGGCFWCLEAIFQKVNGVSQIISGYSGGNVPNPNYEQVSSGNTNHTEVVELTYNPSVISLESILDIFFEIHDPTTLNSQGNDSGTQYRSAIYYSDESELSVIQATISAKQKEHKNPIVTEVKPLDVFYRAEDYHQDYYNSHPDQPYCTFVIAPKLKKYFEMFGGGK